MFDCGFLGNICYDYEYRRLTPAKEFDLMLELIPFSWGEQAKLVKWFNKASEDGADSTAHFKLVCVVCDIIKAHYDSYFRQSICPHVSKPAMKWIKWRC